MDTGKREKIDGKMNEVMRGEMEGWRGGRKTSEWRIEVKGMYRLS